MNSINPNNLKPVVRALNRTIENHRGIRRLQYHVPTTKRAMGYADLAAIFEQAGGGNLTVLDGSFVGRHEIDGRFWDALLRNKVLIPQGAWRELGEWISKPFSNKVMAEVFSGAGRRGHPSIVLDENVPWTKPYQRARAYYVTLLSLRKVRSRALVQTYEAAHCKDATSEERRLLFQTHGGERDYWLLKKGWEEFGGYKFFSDEEVIVTAVMAALATGKAVTILTRDGDLMEQFAKITALLTTHYQAMLFAEMYALAPEMFVIKPMPRDVPMLNAYFDCETSWLVKKPVSDPDDFVGMVLPLKYRRVWLSCMLLAGIPPYMTVTCVNFLAERDMDRLIRTKGVTGGLSTGRLEGLNCHVTGYPQGIPDYRRWVAFVKDKHVALPDGRMQISLLDCAHVTEHRERRTRMPDLTLAALESYVV
jgi:hypothetical protein